MNTGATKQTEDDRMDAKKTETGNEKPGDWTFTERHDVANEGKWRSDACGLNNTKQIRWDIHKKTELPG
jgi:hypothetical protein